MSSRAAKMYFSGHTKVSSEDCGALGADLACSGPLC